MPTTRALPAARSSMSHMVSRWMLPLLVSMCCSRTITSFSMQDPLRLRSASGPSILPAIIRTHRDHLPVTLFRLLRPVVASNLPYSLTLFLESPTASSESQNTDPVAVTNSNESSPRIKQRTRRRRTSRADETDLVESTEEVPLDESLDMNDMVGNGETATVRKDSASSSGVTAVAEDSLETLDVIASPSSDSVSSSLPPPPITLRREKIVEIHILDVQDLVNTGGSGSSRSAGVAASRISTVSSSSSSSSSRNVEAPATRTTTARDNSPASFTKNSDNDPLARLLADAREMKLQEKDEDNVEGTTTTGVISKVLSTIVTADFFVVLALFVWFLAGIFCSYILKVSMLCRADWNDAIPRVCVLGSPCTIFFSLSKTYDRTIPSRSRSTASFNPLSNQRWEFS
jgi:hypothetical protein